MDGNSKFMKAYTVKQISKMLDVPPGTIRQWESTLEGVLNIPRDESGARYYTEYEIHALRNVKNMREKSIGFQMIREVLINPEGASEEQVPIPAVPTMTQLEAIETLLSVQNTVEQLTYRMQEIVHEQVKQEVAAVLEENRQLHERLEDRLEKRDQLLMQTLRAMQQGTAQQLKDNRKKGGWSLWPFRRK